MSMKAIIELILIIISFGYFIYRVIFLTRLLTIGKSEYRLDNIIKRLITAIKQSILQFSQFRVKKGDYIYAGIMHILIIFGFLILLPGEIEFLLSGLLSGFEYSFLGERLYGLYLLSQDLFIFLVIVAIIMAFFRRLILKPPQITYHLSAYIILCFIMILMLTLLGMNSLRMINPKETLFATMAKNWMPVTSYFVKSIGIIKWHPYLFEFMWWLHLCVLLFFLDCIPNSKHLHIFAAIPANFFRHFPPPLIKISYINFDAETLDTLGVSKVEDLTWKQLFDGYACTECGRCIDQCPANNTGKDLSPKDIVLSIKENLFINGPVLLSTSKEKWDEVDRVSLIGESIPIEWLWECTTCGACANVCPVGNEHLRDIIEMRRYLIMEEGEIPELQGRAIKSLEARAHPFFGTNAGKDDWKKGLDIPLFKKGETEYLLWIGCSTRYEDRAQKIARAMVNILKKSQVPFGILKDSRCTGDPAKHMGNEFLFNEIATQNIDEFERLGVKNIITICPHCYHNFVHYYPELGGNYNVIPHAVFIYDLIKNGKLSPKNTEKTFTFHDPCYLGRHNGIFRQPREIINRLGKLIEMPRNEKASFCCGGGGGNYWAEEKGTRINRARAKEALDTGADFIVSSCPFCVLMLTDGIKGFTHAEKVFDIAELVENSIE